MFVHNAMIPKHQSHYVSAEEKLGAVLNHLETLDIDGVPVVDGKKYVGMITRYNIFKEFFNQEALSRKEFLETVPASQIAARKDVYIQDDEMFENTLLMVKNFPAVAVVDEDIHFLGVITRYDILEQFRSAFGMNKKGVRISFTTVDTEGQLAKLAEITKQFHENIISIATFDETAKLARRIVMKVDAIPQTENFIKKLEDAGFRITGIKVC